MCINISVCLEVDDNGVDDTDAAEHHTSSSDGVEWEGDGVCTVLVLVLTVIVVQVVFGYEILYDDVVGFFSASHQVSRNGVDT